MSLNTQDLTNMVESVADAIDKHMESIFLSVRSTLESSQWIPDSIRPPQRHAPAPVIPVSQFERIQRWVDKNRAISAAVLAFLGTGTFLVWRRRRSLRRKRRARRGLLGAKIEAVIIAGAPESPMTRSLAHDLEKRGFLVFIPTETLASEHVVKAEGRADIRPMHLDMSSPDSITTSLTEFTHSLAKVTRSQPVHIASLIILPPTEIHPELPISALEASYWQSILHTHLQQPINLIHAFLPILQSQPALPTRIESSQTPSPATVVVLSPAITPSLPLPNHATEAVTHAALCAYLRTLKAEAPTSLAVSHLQLGAIDLGPSVENKYHVILHPRSRSNSPRSAQQQQQQEALTSEKGRGRVDWTPARQLHHAVFDAVTARTEGTTFIGKGARTYTFVGKYAPVGLVRWMMGGGIEGVQRKPATERRDSDGYEYVHKDSSGHSSST